MKKSLVITLVIIWLIICLRPAYGHSSQMKVWLLNVGQGESVLVEEPSGKQLLFDGGPDETVLAEIGRLLPPWDRYIDLVIISHRHSDHIRGLIPLSQRYRIGEIWRSRSQYQTADWRYLEEQILAKQIPVKEVSYPYRQPFGQLELIIIHPTDQMINDSKNPHQTGLVLKAVFKQQSLLLTGDLDEAQENSILTYCQPPECSLQANILQVPHHGSKYGLANQFLQTIQPELAVIPVGRNNRLGHPSQTVLEKLQDQKVIIRRTDLHGRLSITVSAKDWKSDP